MGILTPVAVKLGSIPWMPRLLPQIVACDAVLHRLSGGKLGLLDLGDLPNVVLEVVGRRSGETRRSPLLAVPAGEGKWLIAGSYFGDARMPAWVLNLRAADTAQVIVKGVATTVTARELSGDERADAWARMLKVWPNYARYEARTERVIPVFLLEPVAAV